MSKLNLINLAKDEISKEESQKVIGGLICECDGCICNQCVYPEYPSNMSSRTERDTLKTWVRLELP